MSNLLSLLAQKQNLRILRRVRIIIVRFLRSQVLALRRTWFLICWNSILALN